MKNTNVVTFGEVLLRLTPPGYLKFSQSNQLCYTFGGSETNVAVSLARFGMQSRLVTRMPDNEIAEACIGDLRRHGVVTDNIIFGGERLGLYYYENTASMRAAKIVYDRNNSSFCTLQRGMLDWRRIFDGAGWFHWSGIAPSLSADAADATMEAIDIAAEMGLTISSDLNFRKNLWRYGKRAEEVMPALARKCHVMFGTEGEYQKAFGIEPVPFALTSPNDMFDADKHLAFCKAVMAKAPQCRKMFVALRNVIDAKHHILMGLLYTADGRYYVSKIHYIQHVVDCVGVGDAMAAGIIYGLTHFDDDRLALEFCVAAGTLKNTIEGDYNLVKPDEVLALAGGTETGNVSR